MGRAAVDAHGGAIARRALDLVAVLVRRAFAIGRERIAGVTGARRLRHAMDGGARRLELDRMTIGRLPVAAVHLHLASGALADCVDANALVLAPGCHQQKQRAEPADPKTNTQHTADTNAAATLAGARLTELHGEGK